MAKVAVASLVAPRVVSGDTEALLRRVLALEARVAALEPASDAQLLAAIAGSVAGHVFNVAELRAHARVDADLARVLRGLTNRQLGKRLRALAGQDVGGFVLQRVGRDEAGIVWAVSAVDLHADAGISTNRGA
jgi:hypothetical protein